MHSPRSLSYTRVRTAILTLAVAALATAGTGCATFGRRGGGSVGSAPASFVRSTSESRSTRLVALREGITKAQAWRLALDALDDEHTIEVRDQSAGFLMTPWEATLVREGVPDLRYRTRVVLKFVGDDWRQLQLRAEANWRAQGDEWEVGYDAALLDAMAAALTAKLGKR